MNSLNTDYYVRIPIIYIDKIIYNFSLLFINLNEYNTFNDPLINAISKINLITYKSYQAYSYEQYIFYYINNQYFTVIDNIEYFNNNNILEEDKKIISFNSLFINSKIVNLFKSLTNLLNSIHITYYRYFKIIKSIDNQIHIYIFNSELKHIKIINISYFFYFENNKLFLKELWDIINNLYNMQNILNYILSILNNFVLLKKIVKI